MQYNTLHPALSKSMEDTAHNATEIIDTVKEGQFITNINVRVITFPFAANFGNFSLILLSKVLFNFIVNCGMSNDHFVLQSLKQNTCTGKNHATNA